MVLDRGSDRRKRVEIESNGGVYPAIAYEMTPETKAVRDGIPYPEDYRIVCATGARYWGIPNVFGALKPIEKRRWVGMN